MTTEVMVEGRGGLPDSMGGVSPPVGGPTCYWKEMWKKLNVMRQMWHLCDVEIYSCDNQMFMAHSPVLAASSEVFHAYLVEKDTSVVTEKGERQLCLSHVPADILQITLDFIYGNMPTTLEAFEKLERGAALLGIKGAMSFIGHKGTATKPGSKCPMSTMMSQWNRNRHYKENTDLDDLFNIDHVLFSIPSIAADAMFDSSANPNATCCRNETAAVVPQTPERSETQLSTVTREALNVVMHYEEGQTAGADNRIESIGNLGSLGDAPKASVSNAVPTAFGASVSPVTTVTSVASNIVNAISNGATPTNLTSSRPNAAASTAAGNVMSTNKTPDQDEEPRCPFAKSLGIMTKGMENPHLNGNDLLTDISLADTYPETTDTRAPPPKKDKLRMAEILESNEESAAAESTGKGTELTQLNELESLDESEFVPLIATKRKRSRSRSKKGQASKCVKVVEDENSNEVLEDKDGGADKLGSSDGIPDGVPEGAEDEWQQDETSQQSDATQDETPETPDSKMIKQALQKVVVDKAAEESNKKLLDQLEDVDEDRTYTCLADGCTYKNKMLDYLQSHMFHRHNLGQPDKQCPNCYHSYFSFRQLKTHLRRTHFKSDDKSEAGHYCGECGLLFKQITSLKLHQLKVHGKGKVFSCEDCEFKSPRKKDMQYHMLSRHNKKPPGVRIFECLYCNYKCVDKSRHEEHQAKHTAEQKYSCHLCGKAYTTKRGMRTHLKYHSDARPHQCPYCPASFKMKNKLNAHIKLLHTHNEVRPFQCGYCNHLTKSRGNCNQHIRKHHKGSPVLVIDHLASVRRPGPGYHYTNIRGQGVIETKDLSMAKWASVGHSENRGYVRQKPAASSAKTDGSDSNVSDSNKYDSDSSCAVDYSESVSEDSCKSAAAKMGSVERVDGRGWVGNSLNGDLRQVDVKSEPSVTDCYDGKVYPHNSGVQENGAHSLYFKSGCTNAAADGYENYGPQAPQNVGPSNADMTCPFAGQNACTSRSFAADCNPNQAHPNAIPQLHCEAPGFSSQRRGGSDSVRAIHPGIDHNPYEYGPFSNIPTAANQISQITREAIYL